MTTQEIANNLVSWCNSGQEARCYQELYSPNIVSIEPEGASPIARGMDELAKKGQWWKENFEVHSTETSEAIVADPFFSVRHTMDTTHKPSGQRSTMSEVGIYKVEDGKIVQEQFFYNVDN
ncbi:MAG: nuclear transport factor 2 family protein [Flavobacteriaceae bacterium]|nr:nuclear transport factor 2 family protein [Flavobacteriaceae bacterium]